MRTIYNEKCTLHIEKTLLCYLCNFFNFFLYFFGWIKFMRSMILISHAIKLCLETVLSYEKDCVFLVPPLLLQLNSL